MTQKSWHLGPALVALARHIKDCNQQFCEAELATWADSDAIAFSASTARLALERLAGCGMVQQVSHRTRYRYGHGKQYLMTPAGLEFAAAAYQARPDGPPPDPAALTTRVWNLLRIRRRLTSDEAAATLVDAGEGDFAAQKKRIGALMAAWAKHAPDVVVVAAQREAGHLRYVLAKDVGRWPPPSRAGQVHPSEFDNLAPVPARFRKTSTAAVLAGDAAQ